MFVGGVPSNGSNSSGMKTIIFSSLGAVAIAWSAERFGKNPTTYNHVQEFVCLAVGIVCIKVSSYFEAWRRK